MDVEDEPGQVADGVGDHDGDQDHAQTLLLPLVAPPQPLDRRVDAHVEDRDLDQSEVSTAISPPITAHRGDGQDAEDDQPRPAVVEDVVEGVGPQLRGRELHPAPALPLPGLHGHHLRLEELGDVEEDGERGDGRAVLDQPPEIKNIWFEIKIVSFSKKYLKEQMNNI